jgi:hypothetical protein
VVNVLTCAHILLAGSLLNPEYIDCHLWKRITDVTGQKICVYRGKNSVMAYHYVTDNGSLNQWSQCPKTIRCVYDPKNKRPTLSEIMDSIKGNF